MLDRRERASRTTMGARCCVTLFVSCTKRAAQLLPAQRSWTHVGDKREGVAHPSSGCRSFGGDEKE
jgi:hypothetical protein